METVKRGSDREATAAPRDWGESSARGRRTWAGADSAADGAGGVAEGTSTGEGEGAGAGARLPPRALQGGSSW